MTRSYSVAEADRTLPYVRVVVDDLCERYATIQELSARHAELPRGESAARSAVREEIQRQAAGLHDCREELERLGLHVKDYDLGLVDFPAELHGRPICLCWRRGEDAVRHWHEVDAGFRGRREVPADEPSWPRAGSPAPA